METATIEDYISEKLKLKELKDKCSDLVMLRDLAKDIAEISKGLIFVNNELIHQYELMLSCDYEYDEQEAEMFRRSFECYLTECDSIIEDIQTRMERVR